MIHLTRILLWRLLAMTALLLGVVGVFLPVLPTVPFILVAAWAASRGWPQLEAWLLAHPRFGPPISQWREHGAVSRQAKRLACTMMAASAAVLWFVPVPPWLRGTIYGVMLTVGVWLWRRPEPALEADSA